MTIDPDKKQQGERNPGASTLQKLRNHARATGEDTALLLARYVIERFLYRLSLSPHRGRFVLRGATLFSVWLDAPHRPTRDVDFLASGESSAEATRPILEEICAFPVPEDGVTFLAETLRVEERDNDGRAYQGLHVEVTATIGSARPRLEIDVAFGEVVTPAPEEVEVPALLSQPRPRLMAYPRETVIAEKTEAMVSLGLGNTRLKDFFDLWYLSSVFEIDGAQLAEALSATFARRQTAFPADGLPIALTERFSADPAKRSQWESFRRKVGGTLATPTEDLSALTSGLRSFLVPLLRTLANGERFGMIWIPGTGWVAAIEER